MIDSYHSDLANFFAHQDQKVTSLTVQVSNGMLVNIAEVVEWLAPSTAVREVACSIPAEGMFSETLSPARTFPCEDMDIQ